MYEVKRAHIVESLAAADLHPVVLKGAAIAGTLYREPAERELADLDLLVSMGDYKKTVRALLTQGYVLPEELRAYRRHHFHLPLQNLRVGHQGVDALWVHGLPLVCSTPRN